MQRSNVITIQERTKAICLDASRARDEIVNIPLETISLQDPFPSEKSSRLLRDKEQMWK